MNCMKCGREVGQDQVFCAKCLEVMERDPVNPDVVVMLPVRSVAPVKKHSPRKKSLTPEEQIFQLKRRNRWLTVAVCLLLFLAVVLTIISIDVFRQLDVQKFLGQNYSTVEYFE